MYIYHLYIKDLISISGAKFHYIISTVKFHTQFEKKTIVPILNAYVYISNIQDVQKVPVRLNINSMVTFNLTLNLTLKVISRSILFF